MLNKPASEPLALRKGHRNNVVFVTVFVRLFYFGCHCTKISVNEEKKRLLVSQNLISSSEIPLCEARAVWQLLTCRRSLLHRCLPPLRARQQSLVRVVALVCVGGRGARVSFCVCGARARRSVSLLCSPDTGPDEDSGLKEFSMGESVPFSHDLPFYAEGTLSGKNAETSHNLVVTRARR